MTSEFRPPFNWRDHLKVHPAADLFPLLAETDPKALQELADDIKAHGLRTPIVACKSPDGEYLVLLDGRNRLDAAALAGLLSIDANGDFLIGDRSNIWNTITTDDDPYEAAISLNIHRRHLTPNDKERLIDDVLKAKPNLSNRQIGKLTRVDHHKVADRRRKLESTGEVSPVEKRIGADGRARKRSAKRKTDEAALRKGMRSASKSANQNGSRLTPAPTGCDVDATSPGGSAEQRAHAARAPERTADPQASDAANKRIWKSKVTKVELVTMLKPILALASNDDVATISDGDDVVYDALESARAVIDDLLYLHQIEGRRKPDADVEFFSVLVANAKKMASIARRDIAGLKLTPSDRDEMAASIGRLLRQWETILRKIRVKEAKDKETAEFARGATP
jgi:ParB-like chromosome segregation protein Spo0J